MPPSESTILTNFLLTPAPLPAFVSLRQFTDIFPPKHRSNPIIKELYRELHHLRSADIEQVRRNIATEVKHGEKQRRRIAKVRQRSEGQDMTGLDISELNMEGELFGLSDGSRTRTPHTLQTVHPSIEEACATVEANISEIEAETEGLLSELAEAVGALSDLRYGRFSKPAGSSDELTEEVLSTLRRLESACEET
ncbi:hypothetical protein GQ43DRAFT_375834 [Delitschia confertaspora ATCC 74209]|uniref:Cnl2/NKP2 family protein n=1 Tax=Delitschia confertaspora ATCC 74209 TaxID=1513339 RepID=A0A9P4JMN6_9PLEO|nr:hypothetical protein GQ43DRAFT_375834 [Delitschia confertaspora ATCC 74209]